MPAEALIAGSVEEVTEQFLRFGEIGYTEIILGRHLTTINLRFWAPWSAWRSVRAALAGANQTPPSTRAATGHAKPNSSPSTPTPPHWTARSTSPTTAPAPAGYRRPLDGGSRLPASGHHRP